MSNLINSIVDRNFVEADSIISETVELIMARKLEEAKKMCAAKMQEQIPAFMGAPGSDAVKLRRDVLEEDDVEEAVDPTERTQVSVEKGTPKQQPNTTVIYKSPDKNQTIVPKNNLKEDEEQLDEARIKIVKARIRGGKIQRRKKISNVPGMTIRGGKLQRMSPAERRRRKLGAKRAVRKRMPKMNRALMKRKRSLMKRRALGI